MAPNCKLNEVGIREGEKIHEVMITKDDSRYTYEYPEHYIIYPHFDWWNAKRHLSPDGKLIQEGFEYNSETNTQWLKVSELEKKITEFGL